MTVAVKDRVTERLLRKPRRVRGANKITVTACILLRTAMAPQKEVRSVVHIGIKTYDTRKERDRHGTAWELE